MKSIIHVNRQNIAMNAKDGKNRPVYTVKQGGKTIYAAQVNLSGASQLVYNGTQLGCGARAWVETNHPIELIGQCTFKESRAV